MMVFYLGKNDEGRDTGVIVNDNLEEQCFLETNGEVLCFSPDPDGRPFEDEEEFEMYCKYIYDKEMVPGVYWNPNRNK